MSASDGDVQNNFDDKILNFFLHFYVTLVFTEGT